MMLTRLMMPIVILVSAPAGAQPPAPPREPAQVVVTAGEGVVRRAPDRAYVTVAAETRAQTPKDAQRLNTEAMTAVTARIKDAGIAADAIQTIAYSLQPEFDYANGKQTLRGYVARNQLQVRVDTLSRLGDILTASVGSGATTIGGIRFDLQDRDAAEREALRKAVVDARARAEAAAAGAGLTIDRIVRIEETREGPQPRVMLGGAQMMAQKSEAPVPLESGEIELHAHVTLTAALK
jgi:uncharacterized protein YggE